MVKMRSNNMKTMINIVSSVGVLVINILISFFLSPYIVKTIGVEANGFVNLANNFVMYADLVVTALNAMAARFITIAYVNKDYKKANLYYNSVFWGNLIIVVILIIPSAVLIVYLQNFINVPVSILQEVKILFSIIFFGFFARTAAPNWDCGTYITNRLDRTYIPSIIIALFRCVFLLCIFTIWTPKIWYVGLASCLVTLISLTVAGYNTYKLTPELKIALKKPICSLNTIKELVGSGIWNSISIAGNMLLSGLDLLICNISLGATFMGILSLSKILPNILIQLSESIRGAFGPELTISYAKGNNATVLNSIQKAMKLTSVVLTIPTAGIIVMGDAFYSLWVPSQDARLLQILSGLAILSYLVNSGVVILFNVFTTVNKVKYNSIAMLVSGGASIMFTLLFVKYTDYDIYAVAGISSVVTIIKNIVFTIPVTSKFLGFKWYQFYPQVVVSIISSISIITIGVIVRLAFPINNWISFFVVSGIIGFIGICLNMMLILNAQERKYLISMLKTRIKK